MRIFFILLSLFIASSTWSADATRDGGTADWMCCKDKECTEVIVQKADPVRAFIECQKLTDADKITRYFRSNAFRVTPSGAATPPPPAPGTVVLSWTPPTQNTDGSALTNLFGYEISYGNSPTNLNLKFQIQDASATNHVFEGLASGTWYFAVKAVSSTGAMSIPSNPASKVIP